MIILHYTLGYPPSRTGGLVTYAIDLMQEQKKIGHKIISLSPGNINPFLKRTIIKKEKDSIKSNTDKYEIINSQPLPLFDGIKNPEDFMKNVNSTVYLDFLNKTKPDIIHIHTLMGIHKEFFEVADSLGIKMVFTTHDYFGLAPEPNFFQNNKSYDHENNVLNWYGASSKALSTSKLLLFQTKFYPLIRTMMKFFTKKNKFESKKAEYKEPTKEILNSYQDLKDYFSDIFGYIDYFHFNSSLAKEVYSYNLKKKLDGKIITITNSNIKIRNKFTSENIKKNRVGYIGPNKNFKGFFQFLSLAEKLSDEYEFITFGYEPDRNLTGITQFGKFNKNEISKIYDSFDILIVPSQWKETFGLVALEAISFGKIVFVSENVGAKDVLPSKNIFSSIEDLVIKIANCNENIPKITGDIKTMDLHSKEIIELYSEVLKQNEFK